MTDTVPMAAPDSLSIRIVALNLDQPVHVAALRALLAEYATHPTGGGASLDPDVLERLPTLLSALGHYHAWLAFDGEMPVGLVNCFETASTFRAMPLINVHDLIVSASHRRRGIGTALLAQVESTARQRGCCKITLEVLSGNHAASAAYRKVGFAPYALDPVMGQAMLFEKKFYQ